MNDWLENFSFSGIKLTEGEKSLMRFAMSKERKRIIKLLEPLAKHDEDCYFKNELVCYYEDCHASSYEYAIELITGEQK